MVGAEECSQLLSRSYWKTTTWGLCCLVGDGSNLICCCDGHCVYVMSVKLQPILVFAVEVANALILLYFDILFFILLPL